MRFGQDGEAEKIASLWTQLQQAAYHQGLADVDSSAFIEVLRGMAGLPKRG